MSHVYGSGQREHVGHDPQALVITCKLSQGRGDTGPSQLATSGTCMATHVTNTPGA